MLKMTGGGLEGCVRGVEKSTKTGPSKKSESTVILSEVKNPEGLNEVNLLLLIISRLRRSFIAFRMTKKTFWTAPFPVFYPLVWPQRFTRVKSL